MVSTYQVSDSNHPESNDTNQIAPNAMEMPLTCTPHLFFLDFLFIRTPPTSRLLTRHSPTLCPLCSGSPCSPPAEPYPGP
jgi:hypothetical protein